MKNKFDHFDKAFESRVRLQIMSVLTVNDHFDFSALKEVLEITDGNLASHLKALEKAGYIKVEKRFINRKPNTQYEATTAGKTAFARHIEALEALIKQQKKL